VLRDELPEDETWAELKEQLAKQFKVEGAHAKARQAWTDLPSWAEERPTDMHVWAESVRSAYGEYCDHDMAKSGGALSILSPEDQVQRVAKIVGSSLFVAVKALAVGEPTLKSMLAAIESNATHFTQMAAQAGPPPKKRNRTDTVAVSMADAPSKIAKTTSKTSSVIQEWLQNAMTGSKHADTVLATLQGNLQTAGAGQQSNTMLTMLSQMQTQQQQLQAAMERSSEGQQQAHSALQTQLHAHLAALQSRPTQVISVPTPMPTQMPATHPNVSPV
jgi:hypothetical protein